MSFRTQQLTMLGVAILLTTLNFLNGMEGALGSGSIEKLPSDGPHLVLSYLALMLVWFAVGRWCFRKLVLFPSPKVAGYMEEFGWTAENLFRRTSTARYNRWFFHVDTNGHDLDLKD